MDWTQALILAVSSLIGSGFGIYWQSLMATVPFTSRQFQIAAITAIFAAGAYVLKATIVSTLTWMDCVQAFMTSGMALMVTTGTQVLKQASASRAAARMALKNQAH